MNRRALFLGAVVLAIGGYAAFSPRSVPPPPAVARTSAPPPSPATPQLALLAVTCTFAYGYDTCEGGVGNLTASALRDVVAVVTWYDAAGAPQRTDEALISFNPVLAGQASPWKTIGPHNPALTTFVVWFKYVLGGTIPTRDDRPKP